MLSTGRCHRLCASVLASLSSRAETVWPTVCCTMVVVSRIARYQKVNGVAVGLGRSTAARVVQRGRPREVIASPDTSTVCGLILIANHRPAVNSLRVARDAGLV